MKKKLLIAGAVLLGLIVIGLVVVFLMLNGIVRSTVATQATQSLKVKTTLGAASIAPFSGDVAMTNLRVASPEGFTAPEIFTLGNVAVNVSYSELFGAPVKVASISIDKPRLVIEQAGGKFNFLELANNLKSDKPAPTPEPADKTEPIKIVIDQIEMSGAEVEIRPGIPGLDKPITVKLPAISLKNIGNADGNQTGEEIGRIVTDLVQVLAQKAAESDQVPPEVRQLLALDVNKLKAELGARVDEEIGRVKEKAAKEIEKGLDNLFNTDKKKDK